VAVSKLRSEEQNIAQTMGKVALILTKTGMAIDMEICAWYPIVLLIMNILVITKIIPRLLAGLLQRITALTQSDDVPAETMEQALRHRE
jgi:hypothetical protein